MILIKPIETRPVGPGVQKLYRFLNGYGASVIDFGYGTQDGLYEVAMLQYYGEGHYQSKLIKHELVNYDIAGWLNDIEVEILLEKIKALPPHFAPQRG